MTLHFLLLPALAADPAAPTEVEAGSLLVDAHLPVEILVNGVKLGQLYVPGEARFRLVTGHHLLRLYTNGNPTDLPIDIAEDQEARVLVGRSGVTTTTGPAPAAPDVTVPVPVEFRVVGTPGAQIRVGDGRHVVRSGAVFSLQLVPGSHPMSVRSADGTAIWATGTLEITGSPVVVQISEGRMPEVSGSAAFTGGGA
jgi:hypothetical protein